jgi:predicted ribosomally synthesized peptide with SipW-like signal peptide
VINVRRIFLSIITIFSIIVLAIGVSNAFFSDTETSSGNTFMAGELDLEIDNTSYYNGEEYPGTTWQLASLDDGQGPGPEGSYLFFNFTDLKPDDEGEDTISLHVENDAYACMTITKTADDDVTCTEPENSDDPNCEDPGEGLGELGGLLNFAFWNDDGDNVLETHETVFKEGTATTLFDGAIWTLADSLSNIWNVTGPMLADQTYYVGKAWCFGDLTLNPVPSGEGENPTVDSGVLCDGATLDNASQTDMLLADIEFTAVQARHNV